MSQPQIARRRLLFLAISSLLALAAVLVALASSALAAEQYGELTRFGTTGDNAGQLDEHRTRLIGVDPSDNSVYVLDEPEEQTQKKERIKLTKKEIKECEEEEEFPCEAEEEIAVGPITRHFRLQKFTESTPGTYTVSASVTFTDASEEFAEGLEVPLGIEGIAVDPTRERLYLLAADARKVSLTQDNAEANGSEKTSLLSASTLYGFSTKTLAGAGTEGPNKEVLAGPGALEAQSEAPGHALLAPSGITVDPNTGEVIVVGHIDDKAEKVDAIKNETDHYALRRVTPSGTLGELYVDKSTEEPLDLKGEEETPNSPTVASVGGVEHVYVVHKGLVEIPYKFNETMAPKVVAANPPRLKKSVELGLRGSIFGGQLSASPPEAGTSTIYADVRIANVAAEEPLPGLLALAPGGAEIGWTGGQSPIEPSSDKDNCVLDPAPEETLAIQVAAGSGGKVFALAPEFLLRKTLSGEPLPGPYFPVIAFGPKPPPPPGSVGCPLAAATAPVAKVNGTEVPEGKSVPVGTAVSFSSTVNQADALEVEWEFGDGTPKQTVTADEFTTPTVAHTFTKGSPPEGFLVKAIIHTDDLATPEVTVERRINISEAAPPVAVLEGPLNAKVKETVTFKDPSPAGVKQYEWVFGDGTKETTEVPSAKHAFAKTGEYKVSLTVANAAGTKSQPVSITVTVTEEEHKSGGGGGGGTGGGGPGGGGPGGGGPGGGGPGGGGTQGVLGVTAVHNPEAKLASTALAVSPSGTVVVNVTCPAGETSCAGTVTLRTLSAVVARVAVTRAHASKGKAAILTLASGPFTVGGGQVRTVTLHLTSKARKLFTHTKMLRAKATIVAHDPAGVGKTTQAIVTLRVSKSHRKH